MEAPHPSLQDSHNDRNDWGSNIHRFNFKLEMRKLETILRRTYGTDKPQRRQELIPVLEQINALQLALPGPPTQSGKDE